MSVLTRERTTSRVGDDTLDRSPGSRRATARPASVPVLGPVAPADALRLGWPGGRYGVVYRHEASRGIFGVGWFVAGAGAIALAGSTGSVSVLAALFGFVAALAGFQSTARWRQVGIGANRLVAGAGALAMSFAAMRSPGLVGVVVLALVVLALVDGATSRSLRHAVAAAGATVTSGLAPGLAGAGMVMVADAEIYAAGCLFALICFYDAGDYVNGSDRNPAEGPMWGIASALIVTFVFAMWNVPPFTATVPAWVFGALAAVLCPLGQLVASAVLPAAGAPAPAMRRLDSFVLAAPVWAWCLWSYLG